VLAVSWDTQFSPVDVRTRTPKEFGVDARGGLFRVARAKTGRSAIGTLTRWSEAILRAYVKRLGVGLHDDAPIFRNRSGDPYSKDTLGDDFRDIREILFGKSDRRRIADMSRSGTVEAFAGDSPAGNVQQKMANTLAQSERLLRTYAPANAAPVREVDAARIVGRRRIRKQKADESVTAPVLVTLSKKKRRKTELAKLF
jgi:hypothetical protein